MAIYGKRDGSIPAEQIENVEHVYKEVGKNITVRIYDAGHAFINPTHGMGDEKAAAEAWPLAVNFLRDQLK